MEPPGRVIDSDAVEGRFRCGGEPDLKRRGGVPVGKNMNVRALYYRLLNALNEGDGEVGHRVEFLGGRSAGADGQLEPTLDKGRIHEEVGDAKEGARHHGCQQPLPGDHG